MADTSAATHFFSDLAKMNGAAHAQIDETHHLGG